MERNRNLIHSERLGLISSKLEEIKGLIEEVKELIKEEKGDYAEKTNMGQPRTIKEMEKEWLGLKSRKRKKD